MTSPSGGIRIARGFIDIEGEVDEAGIEASGGRAGRRAGIRAGEEFARGVDGKLRDSRGKFVAETSKSFGFIERMLSGVMGAFGATTDQANHFAKNVTTGVTNMVTNIWNLLIPALLGVAAAVPLIHTGFALLAPLLLIAGGAAGSLFTIIAGGVAIAGVLKLGFHGIGDALGEISKEGKVTDETLKKLSPNARALVKEFERIQKPLGELRSFVQDRLLANINTSFRDLASKWLPMGRVILGEMSDDLNAIGRKVMAALGDPTFMSNMRVAASGFGDTLRMIGDSIPRLIGAFGRLAESSVPFLHTIGELIAGVVDRFSAWIQKASETGALNSFMQDAAQALRDIWAIGGLVIGIVGELIEILFPGSAREGQNVFEKVRFGLQGIKDFLADPQNQAKIQEWIDKIIGFGEKVTTEWIPQIISWIGTIEGWVTTVQGWANRVQQFGTEIGNAWDALKARTIDTWNSIISFFTGLPERAGSAVAALPGAVGAKIVEMVNLGSNLTGQMVGTIIGFLLTLPARSVEAIISLPGAVGSVLNSARNTAVNLASALVSGAIGLLASLPGRTAGAIASLPGILNGVFIAAKNSVLGTITAMIGTAMGYLASIPGRAAGAVGNLGGVLVGAGRSLLSGLISGIESQIGALRSKLASITSMIPSWKGPMDRDRVLLEPSGRAIMSGLMRGIASQVPTLRDQLGELTASVSGMANVRQGQLATGTGSVINNFAPGSVVLDASKMKSIEDVVKLIGGIRKTSRQFGGLGAVRTP